MLKIKNDSIGLFKMHFILEALVISTDIIELASNCSKLYIILSGIRKMSPEMKLSKLMPTH